ncbi:MAG: thermonuclease family protein [Candidatus Aenigmatarchaeota archaeon]
MKNYKILAFSILITLFIFSLDLLSNITSRFVQERVLVSRVLDGDTIEVNNGKIVRLLGINAPERGEYFYEEAKNFLKNRIEGKEIILVGEGKTDIYGRKLFFVFIEKENINLELIEKGYAHLFEVNKIDTYREKFLKAERDAREKEIGIWKKSNYSKCIYLKELTFKGEEKIAFKNICNFSLNISKWYLKDESHHIFFFPNFLLFPNKTVEIYTTRRGEFSFNSKYPILNREGDSIFLRDSDGLLVLFYRY